MPPIDDDKKLLINFIYTVKKILWAVVEQREILFNEEAYNLITYAWDDLQDDFQNIEIKIQRFKEEQLLKERYLETVCGLSWL